MAGPRFVDCVATDNAGDGFRVRGDVELLGCVAERNGGAGFNGGEIEDALVREMAAAACEGRKPDELAFTFGKRLKERGVDVWTLAGRAADALTLVTAVAKTLGVPLPF